MNNFNQSSTQLQTGVEACINKYIDILRDPWVMLLLLYLEKLYTFLL